MTVEQAVTAAFREEWGRVVATVIRVTGNWDLAEEAAQEAFARAALKWPEDGVPDRPGAWLTTVAKNHALNVLTRAGTESRKIQEVAATIVQQDPVGEVDDGGIHDDRLRLLFTCCHPAIPVEQRIALALRTLGGLTTAEIARAMLVSEPTMAQRLVRAKRKIKHARIPYRVPPPHLLAERADGVMRVLYLIFNEGYSATSGSEPLRASLTSEAIRLARLLVTLIPDDPEVLGLLALMILNDARSLARTDRDGELVPLDEQDRTRWDRGQITEAAHLLRQARQMAAPGMYVLQASIVETHAVAPTPESTDWHTIVECYDRLLEITRNPVVALNRTVAVSMTEGPATGLKLLDDLVEGGQISDFYLVAATRADFHRRLGQSAQAAENYRAAIELTSSAAEVAFFTRRLTELKGGRSMSDFVISADGTRIAFDRYGDGAAIILVGGAMQRRALDPLTTELAKLLSQQGFTVIDYDRRGRGESLPADTFTLEQELEDLQALIQFCGGSAALFGSSSGAAICLAAAAGGLPVTSLALWEIPLDEECGSQGSEFWTGLRERIDALDFEGAVKFYMADLPPEWLAGAKRGPHWPVMVQLAPSLLVDAEALAWTQSAPHEQLWRTITQPVTVLIGTQTLPFMPAAADAVVAAIPSAQQIEITAVDHGWQPAVMAATLTDLFRLTPSAGTGSGESETAGI